MEGSQASGSVNLISAEVNTWVSKGRNTSMPGGSFWDTEPGLSLGDSVALPAPLPDTRLTEGSVGTGSQMWVTGSG